MAFGLINRCLAVSNLEQYNTLRQEFDDANDAFYAIKDNPVHPHQQFVFRVRDDSGNDVTDYRVEFHVVDDTIKRSTWNDATTLAGLQRYKDYTTVLQEEVVLAGC